MDGNECAGYIINIRMYVHVTLKDTSRIYIQCIVTSLPVLDDENGPALPHHEQCVDRTGTNFAIQSGLNGARKGYIALGPVPALDGPA